MPEPPARTVGETIRSDPFATGPRGSLRRRLALAPVALDAAEVVPVRPGVLVLVDELGIGPLDVVTRGGDERLLVHAVRDAAAPATERLAQRCEVRLRLLDHAEVDEREPCRRAPLDLRDRLVPRLEVDLGRRARRHDERRSLEPDACRVTGVERARRVEVRDVVPGMSGRREALETEDAVADDVDVRLGHRRELAPELVERVAVEAPRAGVELRRVDEVRRADLGDVHL